MLDDTSTHDPQAGPSRSSRIHVHAGKIPHHPQGTVQEEEAALVIQKYYRGYRVRKDTARPQLNQDVRWGELMKSSEEHAYAQEQLENRNDVRSRWRRGLHAAKRLQMGDGITTAPGIPAVSSSAFDDCDYTAEEKKKILHARRATFLGSLTMGVGKALDEGEVLPFQSKSLEQQHWLEMIDWKHRYGSNMKYYFRKWKESDTTDNFFRWLDRGEGKDLDLEELPRERLEREKIAYLSAEQRLNYLVKIDKDGRLRWVRNDEYVDTARDRWKDSGDGTGIIQDQSFLERLKSDGSDHHPPQGKGKSTDLDPVANADADAVSDYSISSFSSASYSADTDLDDNEDTHYAGLPRAEDQGWFEKRIKGITPGGIRKELLRKTVRTNTWIYVSDMKMNIFVGIKTSGVFQHSSFLAGGKVTSAGIIVVKEGRIKSLNPLSGHYRSSIDHYRSFIGQLEQKGVDLSHVKIAKSVLSLWGLSKYGRFTKANKDLSSKFKAALHLPHSQTEQEKSDEVRANAEREERDHQERIRKVRAIEQEPSAEGKEEKVKEALFGEDGLTHQSSTPEVRDATPQQVDGTGGKGEECIKKVVEDVEGEQKRRDQRGIQVNGEA